MTDEDIIPQSIGGDARTVIQVCRSCNSTAGHLLDARLARFPLIRFIAMSCGRETVRPKRLERHPATATLKDQRRLKGTAWWEGNGPQFEPFGHQDDGTKWLSAAQLNGKCAPAYVNVLNAADVEWIGFEFPEPDGQDLEPAMLKIILGMMYREHGQQLLSSNAFDVIRHALGGEVNSRIETRWHRSGSQSHAPYPCSNKEHLIWGGCEGGDAFVAGVTLFGRVSMSVNIGQFGARVPNCAITVPCAWRT